MIYKSFLEMARDEDRLCREIQLRLNIIETAKEVEAEGRDMTAHEAMLEKLHEETAKLLPALHAVRVAMGGRVMMLEDMAANVIRDRLRQPGGDGK